MHQEAANSAQIITILSMDIALPVQTTHSTTHRQRVVNAMLDTPYLSKDFACLNAATAKDIIQIPLYVTAWLDL